MQKRPSIDEIRKTTKIPHKVVLTRKGLAAKGLPVPRTLRQLGIKVVACTRGGKIEVTYRNGKQEEYAIKKCPDVIMDAISRVLWGPLWKKALKAV